MPTGTRSAWRRAREDPARLERVRASAGRRQSPLPGSGLPASRLPAPRHGQGWWRGGGLAPLAGCTLLSSGTPAAPRWEHFLKRTRPAAMCEQPWTSGLRGPTTCHPAACVVPGHCRRDEGLSPNPPGSGGQGNHRQQQPEGWGPWSPGEVA